MSEEIEGAAQKFDDTVGELRRELRAVAAAVAALLAPGVEPHAEEQTRDRYTVGGSMGKLFSMSLTFPEIPFGTAAPVAAEAFAAAGWHTELLEPAAGLPLLKARRGALEAGVGPAGRALRIAGGTPVVWIHASWVRPPRVVTPDTLRPGYQLCGMCEGWGSCRTCEGLGFVNSRRCEECGLGMDCPDCRGTGQEPVPRLDGH